MSSTHLETMTTMTSSTQHSRKNSRVYRSPSDPNEPSPYSKSVKKEPVVVKLEQDTDNNKSLMDIDAEDEEAGTILMALAQHASRIRNHPYNTNESSSSSSTYDEKPTKSNSMSIRNLLDPEADTSIMPPHVSPYHSLSSESRPIYGSYDARRNSKKGFQVCITPRNSTTVLDDDNHHHPYRRASINNKYNKASPLRSFRHPSAVRIPIINASKSSMKYKRNTTHIHISYRIHAHRASLTRPTYERYETSPYPSAFRAPPPSHHHNDWNNTHHHQPSQYHYQQDAV